MVTAIQAGNTNYLGRYISSGGDPNRRIDYRPARRLQTPLLGLAIAAGRLDTVDFLVRNGADVNMRDYVGETPVFWAVSNYKQVVPYETRVRILQRLLDAKADPNLNASESGWTPLIAAAMEGKSDQVQLLLAAGANVHVTNNSGETSLHWAHDANIVHILIAAGADPNVRNARGETAADRAIRLHMFDTLAGLTNLPAITIRKKESN